MINFKKTVTAQRASAILGGLLLFAGLACIFYFFYKEDREVLPPLHNSQNASDYLPIDSAKLLLAPAQQAQRYANFLHHYYAPWLNHTIITQQQVITSALEMVTFHMAHPSWAENQHHHGRAWLDRMIQNMDLRQDAGVSHPAITIRATNLRSLPTEEPSFESLDRPGFAYPFDQLQLTFLSANMPVRVVHQSKDHAWNLVIANDASGWVPACDLATVTPDFITQWLQNQGYVAFKQDTVALVDAVGVFHSYGRMGSIYPVAGVKSGFATLKIAHIDLSGMAVIQAVDVATKSLYSLPVPLTPHYIATIANQFVGEPYGWGDLYGLRDCSQTMKDLLSYFGIWLPRNSAEQSALGGKKIDLQSVNNKQKIQTIAKNALPYFTLVGLNGHIMLYLGEKNGIPYVLHDEWGLHTLRPFRSDGRLVVGKTVITPLDFGQQIFGVRQSLLDRVVSITLLNDVPQAKEESSNPG